MDVKGKVAIVTGGTRGIGRAIAEALVRCGVSVCVSARRQPELDSAVAELNDVDEARAIGLQCDVRDYEQVQRLFAHTVSEFGGLDVLINNAGIGVFDSVENMTP